mmetsp:Transcript_25502/g.63823  ORF Transcript_25502/g.63823 Transcript_25502/m.63823 type:complete len:352 (-) Transcript_25502:544-1599(-)
MWRLPLTLSVEFSRPSLRIPHLRNALIAPKMFCAGEPEPRTTRRRYLVCALCVVPAVRPARRVPPRPKHARRLALEPQQRISHRGDFVAEAEGARKTPLQNQPPWECRRRRRHRVLGAHEGIYLLVRVAHENLGALLLLHDDVRHHGCRVLRLVQQNHVELQVQVHTPQLVQFQIPAVRHRHLVVLILHGGPQRGRHVHQFIASVSRSLRTRSVGARLAPAVHLIDIYPRGHVVERRRVIGRYQKCRQCAQRQCSTLVVPRDVQRLRCVVRPQAPAQQLGLVGEAILHPCEFVEVEALGVGGELGRRLQHHLAVEGEVSELVSRPPAHVLQQRGGLARARKRADQHDLVVS